MALPLIYRKKRQILRNFDFLDLANGTGIVNMYGIASTTDGGVEYSLVTNKESWSIPAGTTRSSVGTTTIDFDLTAFNLTRTPKGTATFSAGIGVANDASTVTLKVQLKHWDGSDETNISSEITSQTFTHPGGAVGSEMVFLKLPITNEKVFKKGQILRLTVKIVNVGGGDIDVGHDPQNQLWDFILPAAANSTVMYLAMPFKIDL